MIPLLLLLLLGLQACGGRGTDDPTEDARLLELREQVAMLRDSLASRFAADPVGSRQDTADILVGIRTELVQDLVARASTAYLDEVRLHLAPDALVDAGDEVHIRLGLFRVYAGKWRLQANIRRIETSLTVRQISLTPADSNRFEMLVPVEVSSGSGEADIDFSWDSATMATAVCRDFEVHDAFAGVVQPRVYEIPGRVRLVADAGTVLAVPEFTEQIEVQPEPTEESWRKVREMLERQNSIFRCGIAVQPDKMEELLRGLLRKGFSFRLPTSIMKPIPLPAAVREDVLLGDRALSVAARPTLLALSADWLWYGTRVTVGSGPASPDEPPASSGP